MSDRFGDLNISTFDLLPWLYRQTDSGGKIETTCKLLDLEVAQWDLLSDQIAAVARPEQVPLEVLYMQWAEYGIEPPKFADEQAQRRAFWLLPAFLKRKGNPNTVRDMIILLTGLSCDVVHLWNSERWFRAGVTKSGVHLAGIPYQEARPNTGPHRSGFVAGYAKAGISPIGAAPVNEPLKMTIQLRFPREPKPAEVAAINWSIKFFARAVDIYKIYVRPGSKYWIVGYSQIGSDTKVKPACWKAGISRAGITTVASTGIAPTAPAGPITPTSPGTWVPWYNGGVIFFLPSP